MTWRENAACRDEDTELFFPTGTGCWDAEPAKAFCRRCDVRVECLHYALEQRLEDGIFGGFTGRERLRMLRPRRSA